MSGYYGFSMSNNAMECYRDNIKPLSAWSKGDILNAINQAVKEGEIELSAPISDIKRVSALFGTHGTTPARTITRLISTN